MFSWDCVFRFQKRVLIVVMVALADKLNNYIII